MTNEPINEYRSCAGVEIRRDTDGRAEAVTVPFAHFDRWNEIYDPWEGRFLERLDRGAFADTFDNGRQVALFQHGRDPQIGGKPLGPIVDKRETDVSPVVEFAPLRAQYALDIVEGVEAGVYGASYGFRVAKDANGVVAETWDHKPERSDHNPDGIPERTIHRSDVSEVSIVTFPADPETVGLATVRSLTTLATVRSLTTQFGTPPQDRESGSTEEAPAEEAPVADTKRAKTATAFAFAQRARRRNQ